MHKLINEKGCLAAGEEWLEGNLLVVAGIAVGIAFLQVICVALCCFIFFNSIQYEIEMMFLCSDLGDLLRAEPTGGHIRADGQVGLTARDPRHRLDRTGSAHAGTEREREMSFIANVKNNYNKKWLKQLKGRLQTYCHVSKKSPLLQHRQQE